MERAHDVIVGLLLTNEGRNTISNSAIMSEDLMWTRILRDRDIYDFIFSFYNLSTADQKESLSERKRRFLRQEYWIYF